MAHANLNLLTIIVATYGTKSRGITLQEIIDKSNGELKKSTVHRLLRTTPGFHKSPIPLYPSGYYFDLAEAGFQYTDLNLDTQQKIIKQNNRKSAQPYSIKTKFGKIEQPIFRGDETESKHVVKELGTKEFTNKVVEALTLGSKKMQHASYKVHTGNMSDLIETAEDRKINLDAWVKARNAAYLTYRLYEKVLTDLSLQSNEWYKVFDNPITEEELDEWHG